MQPHESWPKELFLVPTRESLQPNLHSDVHLQDMCFLDILPSEDKEPLGVPVCLFGAPRGISKFLQAPALKPVTQKPADRALQPKTARRSTQLNLLLRPDGFRAMPSRCEAKLPQSL